MATTTANLSLIKPEATDNITPTIFAENFEKIDSNVVTTYTHTRSGTVHNFVGKGATGKAKITANYVAGDTFAVNGVAVNAYVGADAPDGDTIANGRWVMFVYDGTQLNFKGGGGVGSTKLAAATATAAQVLSGKTFYAGNKTLKTGTIASKGADSVTLNASTTSYTFDTSGKYCTGNMTVSTSTKAAESTTITPSASAQSYTFATIGKLCTGNMTVTVPAAGCYSMRVINGNCDGNTHTVNLDITDGAGTYSICIVHTSFYGGSDGTTYYINLLGERIVSKGGSSQGAATWGPVTRFITSSNRTIEYKWPNGNITITYVRIK